MAPESESVVERRDRMSEFPDELLLHILSFVPTHIAARTSLLSRRFRCLWEVAPALDLNLSAFRHCSSCMAFAHMADRSLLDRDDSHHLSSLRLNLRNSRLFEPGILTFSYLNTLLLRASHLHLQRLSFSHLTGCLDEFLPTILSIPSLEFLSLRHLSRAALFPSSFAATGLKTLSLSFDNASFQPTGLNAFLSKLPSLEELELEVPTDVDLRSESVKKLKLVITDLIREVGICMPKLEVLDFYEWRNQQKRFHGQMPVLKKASIEIIAPPEESAPAIWKMLKAVGNVDELHVVIEENFWFNPFHTMVEPDADPPKFPNLKHLDLNMCFHRHNTDDLTTLLQNSPALESINLVDKVWNSVHFY
ncbi:hypothetical protein LUZ61_004501 [Rhynchospora tenuis]|uniref:F-box domain-containing protein n=1 Tax=Rhynchospora tenuis TaxID=198213 RepID=A0AAD6ETS2_9POAL|nr:hypothetical protein LUZ61_004501 [Rhynchospora tenuis]